MSVSDRLNGRRHQPIITTFGENNEQIQGMVSGNDGNRVVAVQRSTEVNGNPGQQIESFHGVVFVSRLTPTRDGDTGFADFPGSPTATVLVDVPRARDATLPDHRNEDLLIDASQRILVTGARLRRRDTATNVFDDDHALFRLDRGGGAPVGAEISANGFA